MRTKLGLALIAITAISVAMATQAYYIQVADAQAKLPNNSVSSETIVNGQVKTDDLATDAVTSAKIKNGEVKTDDLASGAIKPNVQEVAGPQLILAPSTSDGSNAVCPSGTILTGGGYVVGGGDVRVLTNNPSGNIWSVFGFNEGSDDLALRAFALCIGPSP